MNADAERFHQVVVQDHGRTLAVPDNATLREACVHEGVPLYRGLARWGNCGGRARCGTCLVRILSGAEHLNPPTPLEQRRRVDQAPELRLACQAAVRGGPVVIDTRA